MSERYLYDQFPDGRQILGGAPFNVAWNLSGLGLNGHFCQRCWRRLGRPPGKRNDGCLGFGGSAVQSLSDRPTGRVLVEFEDGQPQYEIVRDQAYDYVDLDVVNEQLSSNQNHQALLYHGSLAWRHEVTRNTILQLRKMSQGKVFVDLNIRDPWFELSWVPEILSETQWLKLNVDELSRLTARPLDDFSSQSEIASAVSRLRQEFQFETCFVTAGPRGSLRLILTIKSLVQPPHLLAMLSTRSDGRCLFSDGNRWIANQPALGINSPASGQFCGPHLHGKRSNNDGNERLFVDRQFLASGTASNTNKSNGSKSMSEILDLECQTNMDMESNQNTGGMKIALISLHGLIRAKNPNSAVTRIPAVRPNTFWNWPPNLPRNPMFRASN